MKTPVFLLWTNCKRKSILLSLFVLSMVNAWAQLPTITLGSNPSVCSGITTANLTYSATTNNPDQYSIDYDGTAQLQGFADVTNAALTASPISIAVPPGAAAGIYNGILTVRNSTMELVSENYMISVQVHPRPVPTLSGNTTPCLNSEEIYTTEFGITDFTYTIYGAGGEFTSGGYSFVTIHWLEVGPQTISVIYADSYGCWAVAPTYLTVNVIPNSTVDVGGPIAAICQGGTTGTLGGSFGGGATSAVWSDGGAGGSFTNNSGATPGITTYTSSASAPPSVTLTLTTAGGPNCSVSASKILTVNPNPTVSAGAALVPVCQGGTTAPLGGSFGGGAASAIWNDGGDGGVFTNNGGTTPGLTTYTAAAGAPSSITLTLVTSGGSCGTASSSKNLTVYEPTTPGSISSSQSICYNTSPTLLTDIISPSGGGVLTYQWMYSNDAETSWHDIAGATGLTYQPGNLIATRWFRRKTTANCGIAYSNSITVTVYEPVLGGTIGSSQSICYNTMPTLITGTSPSGGSSVFTYQWMYSIDGGATWNDIVGATNENYQPGNLTTTTMYRRKTTSDSGCGTVYSNEITVAVYGQLLGGTIGSSQAICYNSKPTPFTNTTSPSGGTILTSQWQSSVDGGTTWDDIPGATDLTYAEPANLTSTTMYRRLTTSSSDCGTVYSNTIIITVYTQEQGGSIGSDQAICSGENVMPFVSLSAASGGGNTFTYTWQYTSVMTASPGDGNWSDISGSDIQAYDYGTLSMSTKFVRKAVDITCNNPVYSSVVIVNVKPLPVTSAISGPTLLTLGATNKVYSVTNTPGSTYLWTVPAALTITSSPGLNFIIADAPALTAEGDKITVTETSLGCVGSIVELPVIVTEAIPGTPVTGPETVCNGETGVVYSVTDVPTSSYSWQVPSGAAITSDPGLHEITVSFSLPGTGAVFAIETDASGNKIAHTPVTVNIRSLTGGTIGSDQTICENTSPLPFTSIADASGSGLIVYQWQSSFDNSTFTDLAGATSNTYSSVPLQRDTWFKREVRSTSGTSVCHAESLPVLITVNNFTAGSISGDQTICAGATPAALTTVAPSGDGTFTYKWYGSTNSGGLWNVIAGATSETYSPVSITAETWYRREVTSTQNGKACSDNTNNVKIVVKNVPAVSVTGATNPCPGTLQNYTATTAPGLTYTWTVPSGWVIKTGQGTASISVTVGSSPGDISVVPSNDCMSGNAGIFAIRSLGALNLNLPESEYMCPDQDYLADAGIEASSYTWSSAFGFTASIRRPTMIIPGRYDLTVTDDRGCTASASLNLIRAEISDATFIVPREAAVGDTIVLIDLSWPVPQNIQWVYPTSFEIIYQTSWMIYLIPRQEGTFNLGLYSFLNNCSDFTEKSITINKYRKDEVITGKGLPVIDNVNVYPNPSEGDFSIEIFLNREADIRVEMFSLYGEKVLDRETSGDVHSLMHFNMDQKSGIFLVRIRAENEMRVIRLMIH